jgi:hypothetical protein
MNNEQQALLLKAQQSLEAAKLLLRNDYPDYATSRAYNALPDEALTELANFVEYLSYKTLSSGPPQQTNQNFLLTIAGLGESGQTNTSDSTREILSNEINPIHGWSRKPDNS